MHESKIVDRFQSKKTTRRKFIQFLYSSGLALFAPAVFANNHFGNKKEALSKIMEKIEKNPELMDMITKFYGGNQDHIYSLYSSFLIGKTETDAAWENQQIRISKVNPGQTQKLEILPLIEWYTHDKSLKTEPGVSYLIQTDDMNILFDLGLNPMCQHPSPLLHNMKHLNISLKDINAIVISHNHRDHVGGNTWMKKKTFSLTNSQLDLGSIKAYTPIPMIYPGLNPVCLDDPKVISKGVAAIGTISNQLFFAGRTLEQALAINVKGKGIVLIVGCGHQTLSRILERTESLFNQPVYGIIGGLHYPVESSRLILHGFPVQKYIGTGKLPWESITIKDVKQNIGLLKSKNPKLVGLSAHDSCDLSLAEFRRSFAKAYCQIKAGKPIKV